MGAPSNRPYNQPNLNKNPLESFRNVASGIASGTASSIKDIGTGVFDQLFGVDTINISHSQEKNPSSKEKTVHKGGAKREVKTVWSFQHEQEMQTIRSLVEQLKQEIKLIKQADSSLLSEIKDIEKITVESLPSKPGIYHVRFLELLISILKTLRSKINESRTWLMAFQSKKKKRGSAFASISKKKGTQYSMSQELASARSIQ